MQALSQEFHFPSFEGRLILLRISQWPFQHFKQLVSIMLKNSPQVTPGATLLPETEITIRSRLKQTISVFLKLWQQFALLPTDTESKLSSPRREVYVIPENNFQKNPFPVESELPPFFNRHRLSPATTLIAEGVFRLIYSLPPLNFW